MKRVEVIIDGLNLMHSLSQQSPNIEYLDLVGLCRRLVHPSSETLVSFHYFTAVANHLSDWGQEKQRRFLASLEQDLVSIKFGQFNQTRSTCQHCGAKSNKHSEKQTDVGVATALIQGAYENTYDKVLLFSADTDLIPAIALVKEKFPEKEIKLVSTVAYLRPIHATMGRLSDGQIRLTPELLGPHLINYDAE